MLSKARKVRSWVAATKISPPRVVRVPPTLGTPICSGIIERSPSGPLSALAADVSKTTQRLGAEGGPIDQITIGTQSLARAADQFSTTTLPRLNRAADDTSPAARTLSRTAGGVSDNPQLFIYGSGRIPPGPGEPGFAAP